MNTLIINCSVGMEVILLCEKNEYSFVDTNEKKHSDEILAVIDDLLKRAKIELSDLQNICVCTGPGSFTGVRVAISICKGLAIGIGAKVFVTSNLDVFDDKNLDNYALVLDGFSDLVYAKIVKDKVAKNKCIKLDELKNEVIEKQLIVYAPQEKVQNKLKTIEIRVKNIENNIKNVFLEKINLNQNVEVNLISPLYLRASQAEIEREKKLVGEK